MSTITAPAPIAPPASGLRVNALIASASTLHDHFPRTFALDFGIDIEGRRFATAGRCTKDGEALDPDLVTISNDGVLHYFRPAGGTDTSWSEERFELPELKGGTILRITASAQDPRTGDERLVVAVTGFTARREEILLMLRRTDQGWQRAPLPLLPYPPDFLQRAVSTGFVGIAGGKLQTWYACLPASAGAESLAACAVTNSGKTVLVGFQDHPRGIDRLVALSTEWDLTLARLEQGEKVDELKLYAAKLDPRQWGGPIAAVRFDMRNGRAFRLPVRVGARDASCMTPMTDTRGLCHGMFIRSADGQMLACTFGDDHRADVTGVLTGQRGGPADAAEVAHAFTRDGHLHVFIRDRQGLIWYAHWLRGARPDSLVWEETGYIGRQIRAPQIEGERPYVFVDGADDRLDQLTRSETGGEWTRSGVRIPDPEAAAEPAVVHTLTISTVTAQSDLVPDTPVRVRASRPVVVEHLGRLYRLSPERALDLVTGPTGQVAFRIKATGLADPELLVSTPALSGETSFRPQQEALHRLAGLDQDFAVNGSRLKAAGLLPVELADADADKLAEVIRAAARTAAGDAIEAPAHVDNRRLLRSAAAMPDTAVRISRDAAGIRVERAPVSRVLLAYAADAAAPGGAAEMRTAASPGGFWALLRSAWDSISHFTIEVVKAGVRFVVETAKGVAELVTQAARYIAEGVERVLAWLGDDHILAAARRAAGWLAAELGWDDVIRCKNAVRDYARIALTDLESVIGRVVAEETSKGIEWAKGKVETVFNEAIAAVGDGKVPKEKLLADPRRGQIQRHASRILLIQNAVPTTGGELKLSELSPELAGELRTLAENAKEMNAGAALQRLLEPLATLFNGKYSLADGLAITVRTLLTELKPLVLFALDAVDAVQRLILKLVGDLIGFVHKVLATSIAELGGPFAWINSLYQMISGGADLSVIDLACLMFVTPGVLLAHLTTGKPLLEKAIAAADIVTPLAVLRVALDPARPRWKEELKQKLDKTYQWMIGIYEHCTAIWQIMRTAISVAENTLRLAAMHGADIPAGAKAPFTIIVALVDYLPMVWWLAAEVSAGQGQAVLFELVDKLREYPFAVPVLNLLAFVVLSVTLVVVIIYCVALPAIVACLVSALLLYSAGSLLMTLRLVRFVWWLADGYKDSSEATKARGLLSFFAGLYSDARKIGNLLLPVGSALTKVPSPPSVALGGAMIGGNYGLDCACYLVGGVMLAYRATLPLK